MRVLLLFLVTFKTNSEPINASRNEQSFYQQNVPALLPLLGPETISNLMMFKCGMNDSKWEVPDTIAGELEELEVPEILGMIPPQWEDNWWKKKLEHPVRQEVLDIFVRID